MTSDEFSFFWGPDENILKLDGGDGCTTLNIPPLSYAVSINGLYGM